MKIAHWLDGSMVERPATAEEIIEIEARRATAAAPPVEAAYTAALEAHYDATAQQKRYDNRVTCALRSGYPGPFRAQGEAFGSWMDTCNALGYQIMAEVIAGTRPQPTVAELIAEMPAMVWPV